MLRGSEDAWEAWLDANSEFWSDIKSPITDSKNKTIYVDLFHDRPDVLQRSLVTGKILSYITGHDVVGLTGNAGAVSRLSPKLDIERIRRMAQSYGLHNVWQAPSTQHLGDFFCRPGASMPLIEAMRSGKADQELRQIVRNWVDDEGMPIGRWAYETMLRNELIPSFSQPTADLLRHAAECSDIDRWLAGLFDAAPPAWVVFGEISYNPWAILVEQARVCGASAFWFSTERPVAGHIVRSVDPDVSPMTEARSVGVAWFEAEVWGRNGALRDEVESFHRRRRKGNAFRGSKAGPGPETVLPALCGSAVAKGLRRRIGLPPDRPAVCLLCPGMSDTVLLDNQIYLDHFTWLTKTLEFAATRPDRSWLVKIHPMDWDYNYTNMITDLSKKYESAENIKFEGLTGDEVIMAADVLTTVRGSGAVLYPALGRPVVLAGHGYQSDYGSCFVASTEEEYRNLLTLPVEKLAPTAEQIERAQLFVYAEAFLYGMSSPLLPPSNRVQSDDEYWRRARAVLDWHRLAIDPWFEAVAEAVQTNLPRPISPYFRRLRSEVTPTSGSPVAADGTLAALSPSLGPKWDIGAELCFAAGSGWEAYALVNSTSQESWSVFLDSSPLVIALPLRVLSEDPLVLKLYLGAHVPQDPATVLRISVGNTMVSEVMFFPEEDGLKLCQFPLDRALISETGVVVITFEGLPARRPCDFGQTDERSLSVRLVSLRINRADA